MSESRRSFDAPTAEDVGKLLRLANLDRRSGGEGTLMTEQLVLVRGKHHEEFDLFDQNAARLGSVVCVEPLLSYEFRDGHGRCALTLRELTSHRGFRGLWKWQYEIVLPGEAKPISVTHVSRKSDPAEVTEGSRQIGRVRRLDWLDRRCQPPRARRMEIATSNIEVMAFDRFAVAHFEQTGVALTLELYWLAGYGGGLFVPFADATSGQETYGARRYLFDTVKGADLGQQDGLLVMDFNFAYQPSCAYDPRWTCPLAPPANRLSVPVRAGERVARQ